MAGGRWSVVGIVQAMPLDELLETIETLRGRIEEHGENLRKSETLTRYALIDPLLRELGWDTSDPDQVVPEYPSSGGRADYALLAGGTPKMMVEAKKLGEQMRGAVSQGINYCLEKGTLYFTVTDGQSWEVYETHKPVPVEQKRIVEFDLLKNAPSEVSLRALSLWRPSIEEGQVSVGATPVAVATPPPEPKPPEPAPPAATETMEGWISLAELEGRPYSKPRQLLCPGGEVVPAKNWTDLIAQLALWLVESGYLSEANTPIQHGKRYLLATEPIHPSGKPFINARQVGPLWLNSNYAASDHVRNARRILEQADVSPAFFKVQFAE